MEQFLNDGMYVIDLGEINTAPEIIFELSSVLDKDEVRNKRICLKLGNVDLNQAQLLSIKSLINGIDSTLSSIDTKSVETEKVALALGIIISNVSVENSPEVAPAMPYKTAEEFKEELQAGIATEEKEEEKIIEEADLREQEYTKELQDKESGRNFSETSLNNTEQSSFLNAQNDEDEGCSNAGESEPENNSGLNVIQDTLAYEEPSVIPQERNEETEKANIIEEPKEELSTAEETSRPLNEDVQDELDVIFGSNPVQKSIFELEPPPGEKYEAKEELTDIIVPEQEYTKEDIELETFSTKYIKQTIRSGQVINYEGNLVIIGDCHPGCEITAFGDITVWGVLSGIAHAGSGGNQKARVRALKMNAIQLRIANCYSRRPDSLSTVFIEKTNSFTPEEARIVNGEIVVFKTND